MTSDQRYTAKELWSSSLLMVLFSTAIFFPTHVFSSKCPYTFFDATDVIFIFDITRSVSNHTFEEAKAFAKDLIKQSILLGPEMTSARMAVILFDDKVYVPYNSISKPHNIYQCELLFPGEVWETLLKFNMKSGSKLDGALEIAGAFLERGQEERQAVNQSIWLFTDGENYGNEPISKANKIKTHGTIMYTAGVGRYLNESYLLKLASSDCYKKLTEWKILLDNSIIKPHPNKTSTLRPISRKALCLQYCNTSTCRCKDSEWDNANVYCADLTTTTIVSGTVNGTVTTVISTTSAGETTKLPWYVIYVVGILGPVIGILLSICCGFCVYKCVRKKRRKGGDDKDTQDTTSPNDGTDTTSQNDNGESDDYEEPMPPRHPALPTRRMDDQIPDSPFSTSFPGTSAVSRLGLPALPTRPEDNPDSSIPDQEHPYDNPQSIRHCQTRPPTGRQPHRLTRSIFRHSRPSTKTNDDYVNEDEILKAKKKESAVPNRSHHKFSTRKFGTQRLQTLIKKLERDSAVNVNRNPTQISNYQDRGETSGLDKL